MIPHFPDLPTIISLIGYSGLTAIVFAESGLFFGFFLPGDSLLFTAGLLASQGIFHIGILLPLLFVAAVLGDNVGYAFGHRVGPLLFTRTKSRFFNPRHVSHAQAFFMKHGKKAIFLARFLPIVRTFVPIIAGVANMPYRTFFIYNVIGGGVWVGTMLLFGYLLGSIIPNAEHYLYPIVIMIIIISFLPALWEIKKSKQKNLS